MGVPHLREVKKKLKNTIFSFFHFFENKKNIFIFSNKNVKKNKKLIKNKNNFFLLMSEKK